MEFKMARWALGDSVNEQLWSRCNVILRVHLLNSAIHGVNEVLLGGIKKLWRVVLVDDGHTGVPLDVRVHSSVVGSVHALEL